MKVRLLISTLIVVLMSACASMPAAVVPAPVVAPERNHAIVRTFFATDRNRTGDSAPNTAFGGRRDELRYGVADVSIPRDHRMGDLERPWWFRGEDPERHIVLLAADLQPKAQFFDEMSARVRSSGSKSALLFVHGYNVTFAEAARRTAQMTYDLGFEGAPVFYSWPSQGTELGYVVDGQNIAWSQANMETFLHEFFERSDAQSVYLIAHSMGSRALAGAIARVAKDNPSIRTRLKEIVLAAPDIDARIFRETIAPSLVAMGAPVTLYASSEDKALALARRLFAGDSRVGQSGADIVVIPGIETIDASGLDTGFIGHSYYGDSRTVLSDMYHLFRNNLRPDFRSGLRRVNSSNPPYWVFRE